MFFVYILVLYIPSPTLIPHSSLPHNQSFYLVSLVSKKKEKIIKHKNSFIAVHHQTF